MKDNSEDKKLSKHCTKLASALLSVDPPQIVKWDKVQALEDRVHFHIFDWTVSEIRNSPEWSLSASRVSHKEVT